MRLAHWLVTIAFFAASFDTILNFNVGGVLRLSQVLMMGVCIIAFASMIQQGRILWPRGSTSLALWMFVQVLFLPLSGVMSIGLEFFALLLFTVVGIFAIVQLYGESPHIEFLMRVYLLSYVFVGAFGLVQFALPLLGLPPLLIQQWIVHGHLARINGFSYEPSYFATYLTMGWIMLIELRFSRARITQSPAWKWATILVTAALFLSTSKTAWVFMLVELFARLAPPVWRALRRLVAEVHEGRIFVRLPRGHVLRNGLILAVILLVGARVVTKLVADPAIFLSGTGLASQPAHSLDTRLNVARQTWYAYKEHPFIGRSLGGVSVYIASRDGIAVTTMEGVRQFWGFPVLMDVLVASGLFGFIPFLVFLYANTIRPLHLAVRFWPEERAKWVRALARAMIFEWMLLMVDQNLIRVYLWFHIAMVAVVAYHLEFVPALATEPAAAAPPAARTHYFADPAAAL